MSPAITPVEQERTITILPRTTFNSAEREIARINDQAEAHNAHMALVRNYIPESIGALKGDHKAIIEKLDELLAGIAGIHRRLDRLESDE